MDIVDMLGLCPKEIEIDENWNFEDMVMRVMDIKDDYDRILSSFLWHEIRKKNIFIRKLKNQIYSLNMLEWRKDLIWNYINGNEYFSTLQGILDRSKKK